MVSSAGRTHWSNQYSYSPSEYQRYNKKYSFLYGRLLPSNKAARVLDVGCGGGYFLFFLKSGGYTSLAGVDCDEAAVNACRNNVGIRAELAEAVEYLETRTGYFDLIVCNHMMEHFGPSRAIDLAAALFGALRPGGRLVITVPNAMSPWASYYLFDDPTHDHLYTPNSLAETLVMAGFSGVSTHPEEPVPYDAVTTARYLFWKMRELWLLACFATDVGIGRNRPVRMIVSHGIIATADKI